MNARTRIAPALVILALAVGGPQSYGRADEPAASLLGRCVDRILCAQVRQSEARVVVVGARETIQASLKSSKRSSLWQSAVLVAGNSRTTTEDTVATSGGDLFTLTAAALSSKPVRAPPASA